MINAFKDTNWNPDTKALRTFGKSLMIGFPILGVLCELAGRWRHGSWLPWPLWMGAVGFVAGSLIRLAPSLSRPFYFVWYFLACCFGTVVSNFLMVIIYYGVLTPVGLFRRMLGSDPMERRWDPAAKSYWKPVKETEDSRRYFSQY
jgi:hypothetical protein